MLRAVRRSSSTAPRARLPGSCSPRASSSPIPTHHTLQELDAQLDALAASDFPANNAVEFQVVDVVLTGMPQDITSSFDFTGVPVADVADADALPLGFVASLVDPAREGLATGPVTTPIYLVAEAGPNTPPLAEDDAASSDGSAVTVDVLTNDTDADADMLAIATFGQGADGSVTLDDNGTPGDTGDDRLVYTPGAGFSGSDSFTYTVEDGRGGSDTATVTVSEGTPPPPFELNINAGGGAYTASDGTQFVADTYFSGGTAYSDSFAVAGTPDDPIFQSWRSRSFSYAIDVAPGTYSVELHFAENLWENAGDRVFDILAEGGIILDNFDVVAAAGARYTAHTTLPITVEVTDGVLNLDFDSEKRNPILSAISIRSVSGDGAVPVGVDDAYAVDEDGALTVNAANGLLANDSDADGDTLTASVATDPENGTLTLNADGSFTYVPDADFSGSDSFLYAVSDGTGRVAQATATITVNPLNDDPVAVDDEAISDGSAVTVDVLTNDTDADADMLAIATFGQGADGSVTLDDNGTPGDTGDDRLVYTPGAGFSGSDSFTYTVEDGRGGSDTATVTVSEGTPPPPFELNINAGGGAYTSTDGDEYIADAYFTGGTAYSNSEPVAYTDDPILFQSWRSRSFSYAIDVAPGTYSVELHFAENLWENAGDRVFDILAEGGIILDNFDVVAAAGARYTAHTTLPITVEVTDGVLNLDFDSEKRNPILSGISIRAVSGDGAVPVGVDDAYAVDEDGALTVNAANGLLANDSDADGDTLTASVATDPENGTLTLNADGSFTYVPDADFSGSDSFLYAVSDGTGRVAQATATITVNPLNDDPVAVDDEAISDGSAVTVDVLTNDTDADADMLAIATFGQGADGSVTLDDNGTPGDTGDDRLVYTPGAGFSGSDSFTYTVEDGRGGSDTATVTVSEGTPPPPFELNINAGGGAYTASDGTQFVADTYFSGGTAYSDSFAVAGTPDDPIFQSWRSKSFSYAIDVAPGTYSVELHFAENLWENAGDRVFDILAEGGIILDNFDVVAAAGGKHAAYTTAPITVEVTDGVLNLDFDSEHRNPILSGISIRAGTPPEAVDDAYVVSEDSTLTVNAALGVLANDSDPENEALSTSVVTGPANGSLTLNADGSFVYMPALNFAGTDGFTYAVTDASGFTSEATATITVNSVNDIPVAVPDSYLIPVNQSLTVGVSEGVLQNDADADGDPLTVTAVNGETLDVGQQVTLASGALLTLRGNGRFDYTPFSDFVGEDSFTYTVSDPSGPGTTATVTINVTSDLPPTIGANTGAVVDEGSVVTIDAALLGTTDPDTPTDMLVYTLTSVPANGVLSRDGTPLVPGGSFTQADIDLGIVQYAHDGSETFADGFDFEVSDGLLHDRRPVLRDHRRSGERRPDRRRRQLRRELRDDALDPGRGRACQRHRCRGGRPDRHCGQRRGLCRRDRDRPDLRSAPDAARQWQLRLHAGRDLHRRGQLRLHGGGCRRRQRHCYGDGRRRSSGTRFRALHQLGQHPVLHHHERDNLRRRHLLRGWQDLQDDQPDRGDAGGHAVPV